MPLDWQEQEIIIPLLLGELPILRFSTCGLRCEPDIFSTPPLDRPEILPKKAMASRGLKLAYAYSYPISETVPNISVNDGCIFYVNSVYKHFFVNTSVDFETCLSHIKNRAMSDLRRKVRKVSKSNSAEMDFQIFSTPEQMNDFCRIAMPVSEKSYQQRLFGQGLPSTSDFLNYLKEKSSQGKMLGYILFINDQPAAYNLCPIYGGNTALYDFTGYDPDFSKFSPGTVLQYKIIQDLCQRVEIDYYDLCTGEGRHKELFASGNILCGNIYFCSAASKYAFILLFKLANHEFNKFFSSLFDKLGIKDSIKRFIRRNK